MKKIIFMFTFLLIFSVGVQAQDNTLDVYGGVSYNTYEFEYHNDIVEDHKFKDIDDPNSEYKREGKMDTGVGYYVGLRNWFFDNWALGLEVEQLEAETNKLYVENDESNVYYVSDFEGTTSGMLLTATYDFPHKVTFSETYFLLGLGIYDSEINYTESASVVRREDNGNNFGGKLGLETRYSVSDNLLLNGRVIYRYANIDTDLGEKLGHNLVDYSGWGASLGLELKF